jgi:hypothetical protein
MNSESDYYYDHDDDCYPVQLEGSYMTPRAAKVRFFIIISKQIIIQTWCRTDNPTTEIQHETI